MSGPGAERGPRAVPGGGGRGPRRRRPPGSSLVGSLLSGLPGLLPGRRWITAWFGRGWGRPAWQAVTGHRSGVWDWSIDLRHAESVASKHPGAPVTDLSIDRGQAEPDRWPYTLPVVRHIWEHRLPLAPGATVLLGENGSGKSMLIEAAAAAFRDDWLQQTLAGPNASPHRSSARVTAKGSCRPPTHRSLRRCPAPRCCSSVRTGSRSSTTTAATCSILGEHSWRPGRTTCVTSADHHQSVVPRPLAHRRERVLPTVGACPAEAVL